MSTLTYLDAYCERAGDPALWAEPLNAITNLFFIWFAYKSVQLLRSMPEHSLRRMGDVWALAAAMFAIGIGSGLWHTHATQSTMLADVIPIGIFINIYIFSLFIRLAGWRWWQALGVWLVFQGATVASEMYLPREMLNGSIMYGPPLLMLGFGTFWLWLKQRESWRELGFISLLFLASLTFRTIDLMVCTTFFMGTHFIWHMINAVVLYRLVKLLVANR